MPTNSAALQLPESPREFSALIGGRLIKASERQAIERESPAHRLTVSRYPKATRQDLDRALTSARAAFASWGRSSGAERARILLKVAALIDQNRKELGEIECLEVGKPIGLVDREI